VSRIDLSVQLLAQAVINMYFTVNQSINLYLLKFVQFALCAIVLINMDRWMDKPFIHTTIRSWPRKYMSFPELSFPRPRS